MHRFSGFDNKQFQGLKPLAVDWSVRSRTKLLLKNLKLKQLTPLIFKI